MAAPEVLIYDWRQASDGSFAQLPKNPTLEETQALFKFEIDTSLGYDAAKDGEAYWRLHALYLREGPSTVILKIWDEAGLGMGNIVVFRHWPGAPDFPEPVRPGYHTNGVAGWTQSNGDIGFGLGTGDYIGEDGGASSIWPSAYPLGVNGPQYGDAIKKHGMLGGTNHFMPHPIFQLTYKEGGVIVPPPSGDGKYKLGNFVNGELIGYIEFSTGEVTGDKLILYADGSPVGSIPWSS